LERPEEPSTGVCINPNACKTYIWSLSEPASGRDSGVIWVFADYGNDRARWHLLSSSAREGPTL